MSSACDTNRELFLAVGLLAENNRPKAKLSTENYGVAPPLPGDIMFRCATVLRRRWMRIIIGRGNTISKKKYSFVLKIVTSNVPHVRFRDCLFFQLPSTAITSKFIHLTTNHQTNNDYSVIFIEKKTTEIIKIRFSYHIAGMLAKGRVLCLTWTHVGSRIVG